MGLINLSPFLSCQLTFIHLWAIVFSYQFKNRGISQLRINILTNVIVIQTLWSCFVDFLTLVWTRQTYVPRSPPFWGRKERLEGWSFCCSETFSLWAFFSGFFPRVLIQQGILYRFATGIVRRLFQSIRWSYETFLLKDFVLEKGFQIAIGLVLAVMFWIDRPKLKGSRNLPLYWTSKQRSAYTDWHWLNHCEIDFSMKRTF